MKRPFREHHLLELLNAYRLEEGPLDVYMHLYFKAHKALGSKDRAFVADHAYCLVRWKGLLDALGATNWEKRWEKFQQIDPFKNSFSSLKPHEQVSFPENLFHQLRESLGQETALKFCIECNRPAPTTVRVNALKTTREEMIKKWNNYKVSPCKIASNGVIFHQKIHFFSLPEFKEGLFEMQDEASQLVADLVGASPGDLVLDYCSGSGGKTLAFAPKMGNKGQIFLHDIRPWVLLEAKKRLKRAGIQNSQIINHDSPNLKKLKKQMDWVLVDAPCSGTGTLRRNPDMKWKFNDQALQRLIGEQRQIFEKALSFVKPGGHIVYATCSVLKQENSEQTAHFLKTYPLTLIGTPFSSIPEENGMDGFYGAVFKYQ